MLRVLNRLALLAGAVGVVICFWNRNALPGQIAFDRRLADAPRQDALAMHPFSVRFGGVEYRVEPAHDYELYGLVVSYRQHDGESFMHRLANDHLNMTDICVVWSETAFGEYLRELDFWNGIFTCNVRTSDPVAWSQFRMNQLSNNHLLSADPDIRARVRNVRIGDQVRIKGWLSRYGAVGSGTVRGTSTSREDTGDGACETIFVKEFEILVPASSGWRTGLYGSLLIFVAALITHFRLPFRPNTR